VPPFFFGISATDFDPSSRSVHSARDLLICFLSARASSCRCSRAFPFSLFPNVKKEASSTKQKMKFCPKTCPFFSPVFVNSGLFSPPFFSFSLSRGRPSFGNGNFPQRRTHFSRFPLPLLSPSIVRPAIPPREPAKLWRHYFSFFRSVRKHSNAPLPFLPFFFSHVKDHCVQMSFSSRNHLN